jgi:hypothetical protein
VQQNGPALTPHICGQAIDLFSRCEVLNADPRLGRVGRDHGYIVSVIHDKHICVIPVVVKKTLKR